MRHPNPSTLALYAGQDLGWFAAWRTERHVANCRECRREVNSFSSVSDEIAELSEVPAVQWTRMAAEMRANIRLGLAAGECVRDSKPAPFAWLSGGRVLLAGSSVLALLMAGLFLERTATVTPSAPVMAQESAVLRATANGIELNQGGQTLGLLQTRATEVTYSAGAQGSMRARYVDSETGNVTINNVYVQ